MPAGADWMCACLSVYLRVSVLRGWGVGGNLFLRIMLIPFYCKVALLHYPCNSAFMLAGFSLAQKVGYWNIFISLCSTEEPKVSFEYGPKQDERVGYAMIKCHDCRITKAVVIVLRGLLCCKWIYQSFLCIGAWRRILEAPLKSLLLLDDYLSSSKSQPFRK